MRRKFRKLWRKALKRQLAHVGEGRRRQESTKVYTFKNYHPTRAQQTRRRELVNVMLLARHDDLLKEAWEEAYGSAPW